LKNKLTQKSFYNYYVPIKKIGSGSFATVFLVKNILTNKLFAVKVFKKCNSAENPKERLII
jgi:serine/threonine protein kinase